MTAVLARRPRMSRSDVLLGCWATLLGVVLLGRALGPGYVLTYDMVWVPNLAVRDDVWGLATALPRAVPSDAVVALLDQIVPGSLLQKLTLLVPLVAGGLGAARMLPAPLDGPGPRLLAAGLWQWNPFVVERLVLGQWTVLLGYGVLPWILLAGRRWRDSGRMPVALWWLVPLGCLSPSAGLASVVALVAVAAGARRTRRLSLLLVAGNAPWVVAGLLHAGGATTDAAGAGVFALHGEGRLPAPLAALTLGGVWNAEVVPSSREGALGWVATIVLVLLAAIGSRRWWHAHGPRGRTALLGCWVVGWGSGVLTWAAPGPLGWLDAHVPAVALIRDGGRLLLLCAPLLVELVAAGVGALLGSLPGRVAASGRAAPPGLDSSAPRSVAMLGSGAGLVAAALLPLALLPDASWGSSGHLRAVSYPSDYAVTRQVIARAQADGSLGGDVLVLPLSSYRAPAWNGGRKVLDPLARYLTPNVLASDSLQVGGVVVSGEDPRVERAAQALALPTPGARARALADLGVGVVVTEGDAGPAPEVAGRVLAHTDALTTVELAAPVDIGADRAPRWWWPVLGAAWAAYLGLPLTGALRATAFRLGRFRRRSARCRDCGHSDTPQVIP